MLEHLLSLVVPCYNEEENIPLFYKAVTDQYEKLLELGVKTEIIFVDDGSSDKTVQKVYELQDIDSGVKLVELSRNFGKEAAMYAGLLEAAGDLTAIIDVDLQDPPSMLPEMAESVISGECDCVATRRVSRQGEPPIRSFFARCFYKIMNRLSDVQLMDGARDFRVMSREMTEAILAVSERNRFSKGIFAWVGFKTKWLEYENIERTAGKTKWSFFKLFVYAVDGIIAFSAKPLSITSFIGLLFCFISLLLIILIIVRKLIFGDPVSGWPSLACIIFFVAGIQLFCIGIVGLYVSKTYSESKRRPMFIKRKSRREKKGNSDKEH
ncbi:MAG: glycosyltransferase family 2 protein [Ruminococcaceae bacterium]|nr:glycosyltransferase family 2 protein [Oscillospiraceae bacterium]